MKPGLFLFIFLSATIHVVALNLNSDWVFDLNKHNEQGSSSFSVEITHPHQTIRKTHSLDKKPVNKNIIAIKNNQTQATLTETTVTTKLVIDSNPEIKTEKLVKTKIRDIDLPEKQDVLDNFLKAELNKYFYYPKSAIRRNWQGDLIVSFSINHDGKISDIKILKSSGYDILDLAAINSVAKIELPDNSLIMHNEPTLKSLPVSFRLN